MIISFRNFHPLTLCCCFNEAVSDGVGGGRNSNPIAKAKRSVVGAIETVLNNYDDDTDQSGDNTVAKLLADILSDLLGDGSTELNIPGLGILKGDINVTYYEHVDGATVGSDMYDRQNQDVKSLMWTIPFGT